MKIDPQAFHADLALGLIGVILLTFAIAIARTNVLKDKSDAVRKPYSFSRSQFAWWTVIIACCFVGVYGVDGILPDLNATCLVLLGLGVGTTAVAAGVDASQDAENPHRHQDDPSQGFLIDILSDDSGVSMHRLQAVIFNLIFGLLFISELVLHETAKGTLPEFKPYALGLMGISSAGYLYMKSRENGAGAAAPAEAVGATAAAAQDTVVG